MTYDKERGRTHVKPPGGPRKARPRPQKRESAFEGDRIAKVMARVGVCSRRDAEEWIRAGRVAVNGTVLTDPAKNITADDRVTVDGRLLAEREKTRLFLFNKPRGLVTTDYDPEGRPTVFAWLEHHHPDLPRVVSIGRLDINTEGLLLLTNDGGLARVLELPATGWLRRYRVRAHGETTPDAVAGLKNGVTIDGVDYQPVEASLDRVQGANTWLTVALREGKNREVRRILEHLGLEVNRLIRLSYGPFQLGEAPDGAVEEVKTRVLMDQLGPSLIAQAGADFSSLRREEEDAWQSAREEAAAPPPIRERPVAGKRKHVSAIRAERSADKSGERVRTERAATTDRRGRTVQVERVAPATPSREPTDTRNGRRFRAERGDAPEAGKRGRPAGKREFREDRPPRSGRDERPSRSRAGSDRPPSRFNRDERPPRFGKDERPARSGTRDERPARFDKGGARPPPRGNAGERPARSGTRDERPARFDKGGARPPPRGNAGERPARSGTRDERPARFDKGGARPPPRGNAGERPARSGTRDERPARFDKGGARPPPRGGGDDRRPDKGESRPPGRPRPGGGPSRSPGRGGSGPR